MVTFFVGIIFALGGVLYLAFARPFAEVSAKSPEDVESRATKIRLGAVFCLVFAAVLLPIGISRVDWRGEGKLAQDWGGFSEQRVILQTRNTTDLIDRDAFLFSPKRYAVVDPAQHEPDYLWELSDGQGNEVGDRELEDADLVVKLPGTFTTECDPLPVVVHETDRTVSVGFGDQDGSGRSVEGASIESCAHDEFMKDPLASPVQLHPIDLDRPLGDRQVVGPRGAPVERVEQE